MIDDAIAELAPTVGVKAACVAVGRPRANHYRRHRKSPASPRPRRERVGQPRALSAAERQQVLDVLHGERFADMAPGEVHATLLDEGTYLCSESTMYRILREQGEVRERRRQATHPPRVKPELVADAPNRCWSWDITKLAGPKKWSYFYLYSIIDIYSRYTVGWMVATHESAALAERLLADLGVTKSHSRPHTSNDNPFSEAQFKTLKYRPDFPATFGSLQDARAFCATFYRWYNHDHRHSGIAMHTPFDVHHGHAGDVRQARAHVLTAAYAATPERFVNKQPEPLPLPDIAWINRPDEQLQPTQ